jgi:sulfite reductase (ferredoxin)
MTTAESKPAEPAAKAKPAKRPKAEGQWALGYREPLNANEQSKKDDNPLNVRARIENIYAPGGFESIDKGDLRGRFRWWGLYTQRKPGYDGTWTGDDNTDMLEDEFFMLRVRSDGGALTAAALRTLGGISTEFARDTADISDRQNVQYHWIRVEDMPEIWNRLDAVGLQTTEACGDCPRVVLGSPLAGESLDEVIDGTPAVNEIVKRYIGKPEYSNLPRKFKTAISGLQDVVHEINDVAFIGVVHPEHGPGFDLWVGGGLSTNPMLGQRVGAWVPLDEVPDVWEGVVSVFRDYGYRRLRAKARLKFLIKDWGVERFREVLETEYLKRKLIDGPAPDPVTRPIDHVGVQRLKNGLNAVGVAPIAGRVSGTILSKVADLAEARGQRPDPVHALPEADHPRRSRRQARRAAGRSRRAGSAREPVALAAQPDGLHRHRVLQAVLRRDAEPLTGAGARAGEAPRGHQRPARRAGDDQHQRLPQLVRPDSGRRHRLQGPDGRRRRRSRGGFPGPPRRQPRPGQRFRPQTAPAQGDGRRAR